MSGPSKEEDWKKRTEVVPQILASTIVASLHLVVGQIIAYSGVIVPQMMKEQNATDSDAISITESDSAWIASAPVFSGLAASTLAGLLTDAVGRQKTIMLAAVPGVIGLLLIATASNISMIIWGRIIIGVAWMFISNSTPIYISEISRPDMRGSLLTLMQVFMSIGMVLIFLKGWVLHWRTIAWISNVYILIPVISMFFIPESPAWLVSKSRITEATKSLAWFRKNSSQTLEVEEEILVTQNDQSTQQKFKWNEHVRLFLLPTFYKPYLILTAIFFLQQFSGTFVIIFNCVIFFEEIGTNIDPYLASIFISGMKVVMSFITAVLMKKFPRRTLLLVSAGGMALSISISGLFTQWLQHGVSAQAWVPLVCLLLYVFFSSIGLTSMPFMLAGEMFPLKIRGMANSMLITTVNVFTFSALQCYFPLYHILGGSAHLQYFFATMSVVAMIVIYLFLPETHMYKLIEIENYFWNNTIYVSLKAREERGRVNGRRFDSVSGAI